MNDQSDIGQWIFDRIVELYPICRSITGNGVRESLRILGQHIPVNVKEVPSGTQVFDWTIPKEWNIRNAWIKDASGRKVVDFNLSNLHVVNYSAPIKTTMPFEVLRPHLFTIPEHPDWIPYRTSYYRETWGFCLTHKQLAAMTDGEYEVCIDSDFDDNGSLTYGEVLIKGETEEEFIISAHICHPSLCNDNLSGVCTAAALAKWLIQSPRRYTYRLIFAPGTIGAIAWLAANRNIIQRVKHGLILSGIGDNGALTYKRSRHGDAGVDRAVAHVLRHSGHTHQIEDFNPYGYDERQYGSPGINLPVGRLSRTPFGTYPQYHTSADNLDFVQPKNLSGSYEILTNIIDVLDQNATFINQSPFCEPQLGKRGLYNSPGRNEMALLWALNLSDGDHSILDIAERSGLPFAAISKGAKLLEQNDLMKNVNGST